MQALVLGQPFIEKSERLTGQGLNSCDDYIGVDDPIREFYAVTPFETVDESSHRVR